MTKEEAYDAHISPLMAQIIALCQKHKIPMVADFELDAEARLHCTTVLFGDDWPLPHGMSQAEQALRPRVSSPLMVTLRDGDGKAKSVTAIF